MCCNLMIISVYLPVGAHPELTHFTASKTSSTDPGQTCSGQTLCQSAPSSLKSPRLTYTKYSQPHLQSSSPRSCNCAPHLQGCPSQILHQRRAREGLCLPRLGWQDCRLWHDWRYRHELGSEYRVRELLAKVQMVDGLLLMLEGIRELCRGRQT